MSAVIISGGKQHLVEVDQYLDVELVNNVGVNESVTFDKVLVVKNNDNVEIGKPYVDYKVTGKVLEHFRGDKIDIIKHKRRKHHMKHMGHRQWHTRVLITAIEAVK